MNFAPTDLSTTRNEELPSDKTLCQLLAWLFQSGPQGIRRTSEFYQFRLLYPRSNLDIKRKQLKSFCERNKAYLIYSRITRDNDAFVEPHSSCNNPIFKEKLRHIYSLNTKTESLWTMEVSITEEYIHRIEKMPFQQCEQHTSTLIKEWCKRLSFEAKEKLYSDPLRKEELLMSNKSLEEMARTEGMSSTHLAQVLLGMKAFENEQEIADDSRKMKIFRDSRILSSKDVLFGYLLNKVGESKLNANGKHGEALAKTDLEKMGITPNLYQTEEQQKKTNPMNELNQSKENINSDHGITATPDFLFNQPVTLFGKEITWIEVKNYAIVPGISDGTVIERLLHQGQKYLDKFGPGLILFTRPEGVSQRLKDLFPPEIMLASRIPSDQAKSRAIRNLQRNYLAHAFNSVPPLLFSPGLQSIVSKGHVLGGTIDREEAMKRLQENVTQTEKAKFESDMKELEQMDEEVYAYMNNELFKTSDQIVDELVEKLHHYIETILKYRLDDKGEIAIKTMKMVINNILEYPWENKYKSFSSKAKGFGGISYVANFFIAIGFQHKAEKEGYLEYHGNDTKMLSIAMAALTQLTNR